MENAYTRKKKFYNSEMPKLVTAKGGEVRLYKEAGRLSVSKPQWADKEGKMQMGKTVSIDLSGNKGNQELIELLKCAIEILSEE